MTDPRIKIRPQIIQAREDEMISIEESAAIVLQRGYAKNMRQAIRIVEAKIRSGELRAFKRMRVTAPERKI
jgi:hypothetical protein